MFHAFCSFIPDVLLTAIDKYSNSFKIFSFFKIFVLVAKMHASIIALLALFKPLKDLLICEYTILHLKVGRVLSSIKSTTFNSSKLRQSSR